MVSKLQLQTLTRSVIISRRIINREYIIHMKATAISNGGDLIQWTDARDITVSDFWRLVSLRPDEPETRRLDSRQSACCGRLNCTCFVPPSFLHPFSINFFLFAVVTAQVIKPIFLYIEPTALKSQLSNAGGPTVIYSLLSKHWISHLLSPGGYRLTSVNF